MMNNLLCKTFVMGALICSTQMFDYALAYADTMIHGTYGRIGDDSLPGILATGFPAETEMGLLSWAGITSHAGCV